MRKLAFFILNAIGIFMIWIGGYSLGRDRGVPPPMRTSCDAGEYLEALDESGDLECVCPTEIHGTGTAADPWYVTTSAAEEKVCR